MGEKTPKEGENEKGPLQKLGKGRKGPRKNPGGEPTLLEKGPQKKKKHKTPAGGLKKP